MTCIIATGGYDQSIKFWNLSTGGRSITYQQSQINKLKITPDNKHLGVAAYTDLHMFKIDSISQKPSTSFSDNKANITDLGFEKDSRWVFTSAEDGVLQLFDLRAKGFQIKYENSGSINCAVLHPMQTEIYFGDDKGNIGIWDLTKNETSILQEDAGQVSIRSLDITIDGSKLVAANSEGILFTRVAYEDNELMPQEEIEAHPGSYILRCKFSRCGQYIATGSSDRTVKIWEGDDDCNFDQIQDLTGHLGWVWDGAFTANSDYLLSVSTDTIIRIWDIQTGDLKRPLKGHTKGITSLAFSDC